MAGRRPERVAHLVQAELARLLLEEAKNPLLREVIVTLVRMTPDLRIARVYFRTLGGGATQAEVGRAKVGHLGTLDPFASGLLPLCLGEATKVARYLLLERKEYTGTIRLGVATDTLDHTGAAVETSAVPPLEQATVDAVAARFTGRQRQVPPMYSALKQGGVPLYK